MTLSESNTNLTMSSCDFPHAVYEDPAALMAAPTEEEPPEVKVRPVPRPRSKLNLTVLCENNNNHTVHDSSDESSNVTSPNNTENPEVDNRPRPVRPPPRPPPPSGSERRYFSLRPERPPPPSIYYDRQCAIPIYRSHPEKHQEKGHSSISPMPPALSEEAVDLFVVYNEMVPNNDTPAVPPRLLTHSSSVDESSPLQTRPPPPAFSPPPPPYTGTPPESIYSEVELPSYLDVLPNGDDTTQTQGRTLPQPGTLHGSRSQTAKDSEEINGMLRWLKRVSKSDEMAMSLYGLSIEEEIRTFNQRAMNVKQALRLYNLLMMKRNEALRDYVTDFASISDSLDKVQKKTKTMGIAGGTTGAVGGATAVMGIALAPATFGASLIATAVGAGMVAAAGGMGAQAAKANKKVVHKTTVEKLVDDYGVTIVDIERCLDFILSGMNELRRHDLARLQRSGALLDGLKVGHLAQSVFRNNMNNSRRNSVTHKGGMSSERLLQAFSKEMAEYFKEKDEQRLRKSRKSKFSGRVRLLARNLQDELDYLNQMWEAFC